MPDAGCSRALAYHRKPNNLGQNIMTYNTKIYHTRGGDELVVDSGGRIAFEPGSAVTGTIASATITALTTSNVVIAAGGILDVDSAAAAATGNDATQSATVTRMAGTITTGAMTTAANTPTSVVLTLTGVAAGDIVMVTQAGGTNSIQWVVQSAIATANTITVVIRNLSLTAALNGTIALHYLWMKA